MEKNTEKHPVQIAAKAMRDHWYKCEAQWPASLGYWGCILGHTHPRCEEGVALEKEYCRLIKECLKKDE